MFSMLLLATGADAKLRGGLQRSLQVPNATATVSTEVSAPSDQLMDKIMKIGEIGVKDSTDDRNPEVDDSFSADVDDGEDPESVYEATLRDEQVKADLASHQMHDVGTETSSVADISNTSTDLEAVYQATRKAVLSVAPPMSTSGQNPAEPKSQTVATVVKPHANRIKQLMNKIAQHKVNNLKQTPDPLAPSASMQVHTKRSSTAEDVHVKKKLAVNGGRRNEQAGETTDKTESGVIEAAAKIEAKGKEAASDVEDDNQVGIIGEESSVDAGEHAAVEGGAAESKEALDTTGAGTDFLTVGADLSDNADTSGDADEEDDSRKLDADSDSNTAATESDNAEEEPSE